MKPLILIKNSLAMIISLVLFIANPAPLLADPPFALGANQDNTPATLDPPKIICPPGVSCKPGYGLPSELDWRTNRVVTPVKNQGGCGSCTIFASTALLESAIARKQGKWVDLSEQYMLSCVLRDICYNGWSNQEAVQFFNSSGTTTELGLFPYLAQPSSCQAMQNARKPDNFPFKALKYEKVSINSPEDLKAALYLYGPVAGDFSVFTDFFSYRNGVYRYQSGVVEGGHAVLIVGYSDAKQGQIQVPSAPRRASAKTS